ncbi:hypothetical protein BC938DRAFT_482920 [Jimgerdemannia flammicorona]|uniref:Nucleolar protein 12-domain-containing protein n=1 Tax=Jimgerdemannia flammicorona TaxID=994334 RepID=A0A433R0D9_9FUNG|nr:hypothetical protein BC938DRAFT_482920 [Jimgerdemannia flammicorona]
MDNLQVLSAGGKVYARKRRAKKETVDKIEFDFDARKEFLTGFHKRKLERTAKARDLAKAREHQARLEARRESREERKRLAGERVAEMAVLMKHGRAFGGGRRRDRI